MCKTLWTLVAASMLSACMASGGIRSGGGPPPPPPPEPRHERHHDRAPEPRVIQGVVLDAETRQPIDRASIDITSPAIRGEMTVQTGPDGRFRTEEIPPGEFGIRCRREGYEAFQRKAVMGNGTANIDFELQRKRR